MAQYFHLFHGERFLDLQTFMSLYPSRFREPMDLPSPEEVENGNNDSSSTIGDYEIVTCEEFTYVGRQRISRTTNVEVGLGVILALYNIFTSVLNMRKQNP
ncbi:unnamed protein product [Oikopleura dioica]|uniref:Uncharacterized protein n=1 Tax=Oikopleura dioica TaxID=34765 RepID=E4XPS1_OIKDI|nr:unnamed protein product [Oikopleura dioica]